MLSYPDFQNLSLQQCNELLQEVKKLKRDLTSHINTPTVEDGVEYLNGWFEIAFEEDLCSNKSEDDSEEDGNELHERFHKWFVENVDPMLLFITKGYYVGKRSIHITVTEIKYLKDKYGLSYREVEGGDWWESSIHRGVNDLQTFLKPKKLEEILNMFENNNHDKDLIVYVLEYILCKSLREFSWESEEGKFVVHDHFFGSY